MSEDNSEFDKNKILELLKNGKISEFNELRKTNPELKVFVPYANLSGSNLTNANLSDVDITNVNMSGSNIVGIKK